MEGEFQKSLDRVIDEGASAVLAVDSQGFVLGSRGPIPETAAGSVAVLADLARQLSKEIDMSSEAPAVQLESDSTVIHIQQKKFSTVAIYQRIDN